MSGLDYQAACRWPGIIRRLWAVVLAIAITALQHTLISLRSSRKLAAENLFLRKQLAFFQEREIKPRRADDATRASLVWLSRAFNWRDALVVVKPATVIRWHREGFRRYWKLKSRPGRPTLPRDARALIRRMAFENPNWGEERIANELLLKLGLRISPRTVRKYMPELPGNGTGRGIKGQRWATFVRNHAEAIPEDHSYKFLIRDRDAKFSRRLDETIRHLRLQTLKTPIRTPRANGLCERTIGSIRRECLDYMIPLGERHVCRILSEWVRHYNAARPHTALGPGIPEPGPELPTELQSKRHELPTGARVTARPILFGLHHEYSLKLAA